MYPVSTHMSGESESRKEGSPRESQAPRGDAGPHRGLAVPGAPGAKA